ncbi:N-acyl-D-amino-acid deacylase family protein [Rhodovibrionaceae bacterium A322]
MPSYIGGLAVDDDRIVAVGNVDEYIGANQHDLQGLALAPGFIDAHTHDDRALLSDPDMTSKVSQGVTTVVTGNCGVSLAPLTYKGRPPAPLDLICDEGLDYFPSFGAYLDRLDEDPAAVNALCQVGHSTLRLGAMDSLDRPASDSEIAAMSATLEEALQDGAIGLSTGLAYPPAEKAPTEEVIALAKVMASYKGLHSTHMRCESEGVMDSLAETVRIGREGEIANSIISHHKCSGTANFGRSKETLAYIDQARGEIKLGLDAYPYVASSTMLSEDYCTEAERVLVTWSVPHPEFKGRDLDEIAAEMGLSRQEAVKELAPAGAVYFAMDEEDVQRILAYPHTMIGSDGLPHDSHPHPRLWGTFPRVLGHYARDERIFSLEEAVRKMTSLTANQFGLVDRGILRVGAFADLVVFDPKVVSDAATFEHPTAPATGIQLVLVNGRVVWREGFHSRERPGRAIRRQQLRDQLQAAQ